MFRSAVLKLTFAYLAIIMILSIGFSLMLYKISDSELSNGLRRPQHAIFRETSIYDFENFRKDRLSEGRENLQQSLIFLNIVTLIGGLILSYFLAQKTLQPIEEAYDSQSRFTADASHELRTPLAAMKSEIEVALRDKKLSIGDAKELLASNLEEVDKLKNLADSLLMLARQEDVKAELMANNLNKLVANVMSRYEDIALKRNITIETNVDNVDINVDKLSFEELLAIVVDNAIKYSPNNKKITITSEHKGDSVDLNIKDQGGGIADQDLPHIFDRFYRADESRSRVGAGGFGLGLSIAKKLAHKNSVSLYVKHTSKKGTTFCINAKIV